MFNGIPCKGELYGIGAGVQYMAEDNNIVQLVHPLLENPACTMRNIKDYLNPLSSYSPFTASKNTNFYISFNTLNGFTITEKGSHAPVVFFPPHDLNQLHMGDYKFEYCCVCNKGYLDYELDGDMQYWLLLNAVLLALAKGKFFTDYTPQITGNNIKQMELVLSDPIDLTNLDENYTIPPIPLRQRTVINHNYNLRNNAYFMLPRNSRNLLGFNLLADGDPVHAERSLGWDFI